MSSLNPDIAQAIPRLVESGALPPEKAPHLLRVARGELVSVRWELRALLYLGVLLVTGGVGLLVKENLDRIGPVAIAWAIAIAAAAALIWVEKKASRFSWEEVPSPNLAYDYVLLLGVLLFAADLAYIEVQFAVMRPIWDFHLFIVALVAGVAAFRYDSRIVFSLALSTFAAWRGAWAFRNPESLLGNSPEAVHWNMLGCGIGFVILGLVLVKKRRKAHFEPVAVHLGWLLILGALAFGMEGPRWAAWTLALLSVGLGLAVGAYLFRRFPLFAFGVIGAYAALTRLAFGSGIDDFVLGCFWFFATPLLVIFGLVMAQRRMKEPL